MLPLLQVEQEIHLLYLQLKELMVVLVVLLQENLEVAVEELLLQELIVDHQIMVDQVVQVQQQKLMQVQSLELEEAEVVQMVQQEVVEMAELVVVVLEEMDQ